VVDHSVYEIELQRVKCRATIYRHCRVSSVVCYELITVASIARIPLGSSRHVSTRYDTFDMSSALRRACRAVLFDKLDTAKCMGSTRRTRRVVSRRDVTSQMEFGHISPSDANESFLQKGDVLVLAHRT